MEFDMASGRVGERDSVFVVAEVSANHLQKFSLAEDTIHAARTAGADAVKLQTYTPDTMTIDCDRDVFQIKHGTAWDGQTLYQLYQQAHTPWEWHAKLKGLAEDLGMVFFSTPFDLSAVDFLENLGVPIYKIASFEITDIPLIRYVAAKQKPVVMSTGIASLEDIETAVAACRQEGNGRIALLKCTSAYPTPVEESHLRVIPELRERFGVMVGISDHSLAETVPATAVALGARIVEKHLILDRGMGGPDARFSLEPDEFRRMVVAVRQVEASLGHRQYTVTEQMEANRVFSRSLFAVEDIKKGEKFNSDNIRSIRPGAGLHPKHYFEVLQSKAGADIPRGTPLSWDLIELPEHGGPNGEDR
jgi:pseudaminic acid synthase